MTGLIAAFLCLAAGIEFVRRSLRARRARNAKPRRPSR